MLLFNADSTPKISLAEIYTELANIAFQHCARRKLQSHILVLDIQNTVELIGLGSPRNKERARTYAGKGPLEPNCVVATAAIPLKNTYLFPLTIRLQCSANKIARSITH